MPERMIQRVESIKKWMLVGGLINFVLLVVLAFVVYTDRNNEADNRKRDEQFLLRSRVETCHLYNSDQSVRRQFQKDNILTLIGLSGQNSEIVKVSDEFLQYSLFIDKSYPYRQCSEHCVIALTDPTLPDCPPADNEEGK